MRIVDSPHPFVTAANFVAASLSEYAGPTLLLLSGGSASNVYELLAGELHDCAQLTIGLADERYNIDPQHTFSNGRLIESTGLTNRVLSHGGSWEPVLHGKSRGAEVASYGRLLGSFINNPTARVVGVLGIGADGHTAGILPDVNATRFADRFCGEDLVVGYDSHDKFGERITITIAALRQVNEVFVVAADQAKLLIIDEITSTTKSINLMPATIFKELPEVTIIKPNEAN